MSASKKKTLIASAISLFVVLAIIIIFIYPALRRFNRNVEEFNNARRELSTFQEKSSSFYDAKKVYISWQPSFDKISKLFIDKDAPIDFIKFLENTAHSSGLVIDISSASVNPKSETEPWDSISFQLNLTGSFDDLMIFLQKLEASPYLIKEKGIIIRKLTTQNTSGVNGILDIQVYTN